MICVSTIPMLENHRARTGHATTLAWRIDTIEDRHAAGREPLKQSETPVALELTASKPRPIQAAVLSVERVLVRRLWHLDAPVIVHELCRRVESRIRSPANAGDMLTSASLKEVTHAVVCVA